MNLAGKGAPRVNYRLGRRDGIWLGKSQKTSHAARGKRVVSQRSGSVASAIMTTFRILFGIDALAAALVAFFFVWGLSDGSVPAFSILLWLALLGGVGAVLVGGLWLSAYGQRRLANGVLLILAIPTTLIGLFFLGVIILQPRWN